jgi:hypothetical protein
MADDFNFNNPYSAPQTSGQIPPMIEGGGLKSLGQEARKSSLNKARWIMIILGVLMLAFNIWGVFYIEQEVQNAVRRGMMVNHSIIQQLKIITYISIGIGALFIVMGIMVHQFPIPFTITALVLYLLGQVIMFVYNPESLANVVAWAIRIAIIAGLWQSIQAAIAYEKERKMAAYR